MSNTNIIIPWPEWRIVEKIGEGSFGTVYKAVREEHNVISYSAIKILSIPQSETEINSFKADGFDEKSTRSYFEDIMKSFVNEIKMLEQMKGTSNIVSVEDYKVVEKEKGIGWDIFIRMELLTSFIDYANFKKLNETEVIKLGIDICSALELCEKKKIIHRDIKPQNIFISSFGDFKLGDFGIARELEKTSRTMSGKGTPDYMAPEVRLAKKYDASIDTYSLGLVLYKLLNNNRLPFLDPNSKQIHYGDRENALNRRLDGEQIPPPVEASLGMQKIILKACSFTPSNRYKSASEMKKALEHFKNLSDNNIILSPRDEVEELTIKDETLSKTEVDVTKILNSEESKTIIDSPSAATNEKFTPKENKSKLFIQLIHCDKCGYLVRKNQNYCPKCGSTLPNSLKQKTKSTKHFPNDQDNKAAKKHQGKRQKTTFILLTITAIVALLFTFITGLPPSKKQIKIGFSMRSTVLEPFNKDLKNYLSTYNNDSMVYELIGLYCENSSYLQNSTIDSLITNKCDVIIVDLVDYKDATLIVEKCKQASIPVLFINNNPPKSFENKWPGKVSFINYELMSAGTVQGDIVVSLPRNGDLNGSGIVEYIMLTGDPNLTLTSARKEAAIKVLSDMGIIVKALEIYNARMHRDYAEKAMAKFLTKYKKGKIDVILAHNDDMAMGALAALENAGWVVGRDVYLIGLGGTDEACDAVKNGKMTGTVSYNYSNVALKVAEIAVDMANGKDVRLYYSAGYIPITK